MAKTTNPQGNVWIQSDVPLSKDDKDTVLKKVQDVMQKKSNEPKKRPTHR